MADSGFTESIQTLLGGMRFRTTALATVVVGLALTACGVALVTLTHATLSSSVRTTAESRARDVAALAEEGTLPVPLPGRGEALVAQVVTVDDTVLSSSADIEGEGPLSDVRLSPGQAFAQRVRRFEPFDDGDDDEDDGEGPVWLVGLGVLTPDGEATVLVAASLDPAESFVEASVPLLLAALPVILAVTAGAVWILAGRTLQPVENIRTQAAAISATELGRRVPVPASRDEVHRLAVTVNAMLGRIEAAALQQRRFVADASHELRSPVAAIRTMLEVAQRNIGAVDCGELIEDLLREDLRLECLTADLLTLAQHDERGLAVRKEEVNLAGLVREEIAAAQSRRRVSVHLASESAVSLLADAAMVRSIIRNLLDNAIRHATDGVWVDTFIDGDAVVAQVSDDGPGIVMADRERVFERFVRLDEARNRSEGGAGLGLAVCRAIAETHGGSVRVVEPLCGGATFELRLPLA